MLRTANSAVRARDRYKIMMLIAAMSPPVQNKGFRTELMNIDVLTHDLRPDMETDPTPLNNLYMVCKRLTYSNTNAHMHTNTRARAHTHTHTHTYTHTKVSQSR